MPKWEFIFARALSAGSKKKILQVFFPRGRNYEKFPYEDADVDDQAGGRLVYEGHRLHNNGRVFFFLPQSGRGQHGVVQGRFSWAQATLLSLLRLAAVP